jgi:hypothetical protein
MQKKYPTLAARGGFSLTNFTSKVAYHPTVERLTLQPWTRENSQLIDAFITYCDRPVTGGSN